MSQTTPANPDGETVLTIITAVLIAACSLVWAAGQLAARIWNGFWLPTPVSESPLILWGLVSAPTQPGQAWPPGSPVRTEARRPGYG